jgi:hypothetical protein
MAGTVSQQHNKIGAIGVITLTCVGDSSDGSFPGTELEEFEGRLLALETDPGTPAPTSNWDVVVNDSNGVDVLQGVGANRHTTTSEKVAVVFSGTSVHPPVDKTDTLTAVISGNSVASAQLVIKLYYLKG